MNVHVTYKLHKTPDIEKEINHQIEKLSKRLQVFRPELIHLKAALEQGSPREGTHFSINLRLPSGQMAAQGYAGNARAAIKNAFDDITQQIRRHKDLLRSSHKWRRRGSATEGVPDPGVPFEQTVAAIVPLAVSPEDVRSYVNANLSRLERFVERELYFRRTSREAADGISTEEVVDEVIALALSEGDRPEKLAIEPWLYHLAIQVMNEMNALSAERESTVHLEDSRRRQNVEASDEPVLQFHQPDEAWTKESSIADWRVTTPEQARYSFEVVSLVQSALKNVDRTDREAFLLYGIEGFSVPEIAAITGRQEQAVQDSIARAAALVRSTPSVAHEFRQLHIKKTGT
jgi:DNA-directed RNA polymerase specialized sigma24 family protein/ribosome-associated translation inhibitor RaiA